ncbi:MAG: VCBS repeat-containing protein, partial [Thermodesulfovibrionales bacterium]|nr:VCBS repeat-containing protein [Thermodesulfovibrionales bacterium]
RVPGKAKLTVLTSKYARPGTYGLIVTGDDGLVKHKLNLNLNLILNPEITAGIIVTPGPGPKNPASVKLINSELKTRLEFTAFNTKYGANAVMADIDGDGYDEIIVAPGPDPKAKANVRVYRKNGSFMFEQKIFDAKYGLTLSAADFDGDWKDEIIVGMGPDPKNPAKVKALSFDGSRFISTGVEFNAFKRDRKNHDDEEHTTYGANIAAGDVDGDNIPELLVAPGAGSESPAIVKVFKVDTSSGLGLWKISGTYSQFTAFTEHEAEGHHERNREEDPADYGVNIAAGDIDGDGISEIIVGAGPDPKNISLVKVFRGDGTFTGISFVAYPEIKEHHDHKEKDSRKEKDDEKEAGNYGVYVAVVDINGDGRDEMITGLGPGPQNSSWVRIFKCDGTLLSNGFIAFPEDTKYGVKVSTGNMGN